LKECFPSKDTEIDTVFDHIDSATDSTDHGAAMNKFGEYNFLRSEVVLYTKTLVTHTIFGSAKKVK